MFTGFTKDAVDFLWGIALNNERNWFLEHKNMYLSALNAPMKELSVAVLDQMNKRHPDLKLITHVCRIYRDARRLHGRGPYKDHLWFTLHHPQDQLEHTVCLYFEVAPNGFSYGCGYWDMEAVTAAKLRRRIEQDPKPLEKIMRKLNKSRFTLHGETYKRPKGDVGTLLNPIYNRKHISLDYADNCEGIFFTPQLADELVSGFEELLPLYRYLYSLPGDPDPN